MMAKNAKPTTMAMDRKMQAECDMHTMMRAHEVMADPKRMKAAQAAAEAEAKRAKQMAIVIKKGPKK